MEEYLLGFAAGIRRHGAFWASTLNPGGQSHLIRKAGYLPTHPQLGWQAAYFIDSATDG
jgi:hypothetical protein